MSRAALKAAQTNPDPTPSTSSTTANTGASAARVEIPPAPPVDSEPLPSPSINSLAAPPTLPGVQSASTPIATPIVAQQRSSVPPPLSPPSQADKMFRIYRNKTAPKHVLRCEWSDRQTKPGRTTPLWLAYLTSAEGQAALKLIEERVAAN